MHRQVDTVNILAVSVGRALLDAAKPNAPRSI